MHRGRVYFSQYNFIVWMNNLIIILSIRSLIHIIILLYLICYCFPFNTNHAKLYIIYTFNGIIIFRDGIVVEYFNRTKLPKSKNIS